MKIPFILCQYKCTLDRNNFAAASKFEFKILARGGGGKGRFEKIFLRVRPLLGWVVREGLWFKTIKILGTLTRGRGLVYSTQYMLYTYNVEIGNSLFYSLNIKLFLVHKLLHKLQLDTESAVLSTTRKNS